MHILYSSTSLSVFGATIYYAKQYKRNLKRSQTKRRQMQPSVMVVSREDDTQIKTHQEDWREKSINALKEQYDVLPPNISVTTATIKEPRFRLYIY